MSLINFKNYSKTDKIKLMEELWLELTKDDQLDAPQWHENILNERLDLYKKGEMKTYSLEEVKTKYDLRFHS